MTIDKTISTRSKVADGQRYNLMKAHLDERGLRLWAARSRSRMVAKGESWSRATGLGRNTGLDGK